MKRIIALYQNLKIRNKILVCFFVVILVSLGTIGLLYNASFENSMTELANESTMVIIEQANQQVEMQMHMLERLIAVIEQDGNVKNYLRKSSEAENEEIYLTRLSVCNKLEEYRETYPEITGITIVSRTGSYISNEMYKTQKRSLVLENWYIECARRNGDMLTIEPISRNLTYYETVSVDEILCVGKAVTNENGKVIGAILLDVELNSIEQILENITLGKEGFVVIMDGENFIYSPVNPIAARIDTSWLPGESGIFERTILGERYQFIYNSFEEFGWKTVGIFSLGATLRQVREMQNILLLILAMAGIFSLILALTFATTVVRPITKLERLMTEAQSGNFHVRFHARYQDEIGSLGRAFNEMLDRIQMLIDQVFSAEKKKRYAEINALQAQIKPHFLYNTFDTIHWLAKKYGAKDIVYIIQCLTNLFRIGLSGGSEIITLREEVSHVENYLKIQKVRYEDILEFEMDIAENLKGFYVHKLILQPIVENALYHGIKASRRKGKISITAGEDGRNLVIMIRDNGVGMSEERVREINDLFETGKSRGSGYGMFNVDQRIKLSYGNDYGLRVESDPGHGTTVTIVTPKVTHLE